MSPLGDLFFVQINMKQILDKFLKLSKGCDSFCQSTWLLNTIFDLALVLVPHLGKFCSVVYVLADPHGPCGNSIKHKKEY